MANKEADCRPKSKWLLPTAKYRVMLLGEGSQSAIFLQQMSRFGHLELGTSSNPSTAPKHFVADSSQAQCLQEAQAAFERAEFEPALRWFGRCLEHGPNYIPAWVGQVQALLELGRPGEAKVWADKALERFVDQPELLALKGMALGRLGETATALAFSDAAVARPGDSPTVWLGRADVLLARGEKSAEHCFTRALQLAPGDVTLRWLAARIRAFWGQFAAALKLVQDAVALAPDRFALWVDAGLYQAELGLSDPAIRSFHQALALQPGCRLAQNGLNALGDVSILQKIRGWWRRQA